MTATNLTAYQNRIAQARRDARTELLMVIAGSLTPSTLAAVIADLGDNCQDSDRMQRYHEEACNAFELQLEVMEGKDAFAALEPQYENSPAGKRKVQYLNALANQR